MVWGMKLKHIDWIACIVFGISAGLISFYLKLPVKNDGILYLLSTISQALAAIFALVFTVTLMAAQMAQKYTAIDKFFDRKTKVLMVMYAVGIIFPALILKMDSTNGFYNIFVSITIGLMAFCVAAIIPYLKSCNDVIKFETGVSNLFDEINESASSYNYPKAEQAVYELRDIAKSAIQEEREKPLFMIDIAISNLVKFGLLRQGDILPTFSAYRPLIALSEIGISAAAKRMDNVANAITLSLQECGRLVIDKDFIDGSAGKVIETLKQIGINSTKQKLKSTSVSCLVSLLGLANGAASKENWEYESEKAYNYFGICAAHFERYFPEQVDAVCDEIKSMNMQINKDLLNKIKTIISKQYPDLNGCLEKFLERLDKK